MYLTVMERLESRKKVVYLEDYNIGIPDFSYIYEINDDGEIEYEWIQQHVGDFILNFRWEGRELWWD